jgi:hypothetical protein
MLTAKPFYCYDVSRNIFIPIYIDFQVEVKQGCIFITPHGQNEAFHSTHAFIVLPVFLCREMLFSVDTNHNLRLLGNGLQLKELAFSINESFKFNNRFGYNTAKALNENRPNYSYIINNIFELKKELLGAFHYIINSACACPHKGKLEEEIKEKIESNII